MPWLSYWRYRRAIWQRAYKNLVAHRKRQGAVAVIIGLVAWIIALATNVGVGSSLAYGLVVSLAWVVVAVAFYRFRAAVELHTEVEDERNEALTERAALLAEKERTHSINLEFHKVDAVPMSERLPGYSSHPLWLVGVVVYNHGPGDFFKAVVVDQSVKHLVDDEAYPVGSVALRWQLPNITEWQPIPQGSDAKIDVAWVLPGANTVIFLGPRHHRWQSLQPGSGRLTGLIDVQIRGRDAHQTVAFALLSGPTDPVDLSVTPILSGTA